MVRSFVLPLGFALSAALALAGCSSDSGEACRANRDCASGFTCCAMGSVASGGERGACQRTCVFVGIDAGEGTDAGDVPVDSGTDAGEDAGEDAGDATP